MARTLEFDRDEIILKAMEVFSEKGFHGSSLADLTKATGLHKGSLYNAFKSKENLFLLSLQKYGELSQKNFIADEPPIEYLKNFFRRLVSEGSTDKNYKGCLVMNTRLEFGRSRSKSQQLSKKLYDRIGENFKKALTMAQEEKELNSSIDIELVKERLVVAAFSIREMSKFNKDKKFLESIANNALSDIGITI